MMDGDLEEVVNRYVDGVLFEAAKAVESEKYVSNFNSNQNVNCKQTDTFQSSSLPGSLEGSPEMVPLKRSIPFITVTDPSGEWTQIMSSSSEGSSISDTAIRAPVDQVENDQSNYSSENITEERKMRPSSGPARLLAPDIEQNKRSSYFDTIKVADRDGGYPWKTKYRPEASHFVEKGDCKMDTPVRCRAKCSPRYYLKSRLKRETHESMNDSQSSPRAQPQDEELETQSEEDEQPLDEDEEYATPEEEPEEVELDTDSESEEETISSLEALLEMAVDEYGIIHTRDRFHLAKLLSAIKNIVDLNEPRDNSFSIREENWEATRVQLLNLMKILAEKTAMVNHEITDQAQEEGFRRGIREHAQTTDSMLRKLREQLEQVLEDREAIQKLLISKEIEWNSLGERYEFEILRLRVLNSELISDRIAEGTGVGEQTLKHLQNVNLNMDRAYTTTVQRQSRINTLRLHVVTQQNRIIDLEHQLKNLDQLAFWFDYFNATCEANHDESVASDSEDLGLGRTATSSLVRDAMNDIIEECDLREETYLCDVLNADLVEVKGDGNVKVVSQETETADVFFINEGLKMCKLEDNESKEEEELNRAEASPGSSFECITPPCQQGQGEPVFMEKQPDSISVDKKDKQNSHDAETAVQQVSL